MTTVAPRSPIALLGGTFDPVHLGHLRPAIELLQNLGLAELRLVPGFVPPHRPPPRATPERRLAMLRQAIEGVPGFSIDACEFERAGPSYTVDTLRRVRNEIGPDRPLCFIMGADAFRGLMGWYQWHRLSEYAHLVIMERPGITLEALPAELAQWLSERRIERRGVREQPAGGVRTETVSPMTVSSTGVRRYMAQGRSARFLVPDGVWQSVAGAGVYGYPQP